MKKLMLSFLIASSFVANASTSDSEFPGLKEGKDYLKTKVNVEQIVLLQEKDKNKPVLAEMFWYGCGHCYSMVPMTKKLFEKYDSKIVPVYFPVGFQGWETGVKMYYTLEQMNLIPEIHDKVFYAIHVDKKKILDKINFIDRDKFLEDNKVDVNKFNEIYKSFTIANKFSKAKTITNDLKIESSPSYAIFYKGNTYQTSPGLTGSYQDTIRVLDTILMEQIKESAVATKVDNKIETKKVK